MAQNITLLGASYSNVPAVTLPKTGGGTASFTDVTDTTATAADVANTKYFYTAAGVRTQGTNSGGVTPTGNIDITQAGVTDVTNYATATVPDAQQWIDVSDEGFYTESNTRKWKARPYAEINLSEGDAVGWVGEGITYGEYFVRDAVASGITITPTTSSQTIGGFNFVMEGPVTVSAMPSGSATPASTISATGASVSTGTNTLTLSKSVSNTPTVSAGYVASGTAGNSSVSLTASVTTKAAATITPTTTNQTIASGTYLTGTQTIAGDANLVAGNIKNGTTIFNVTGTYTGGGSGANLPTFIITWYDDFSSVKSVTCDKSYADCFSLMSDNENYSALAHITDESETFLSIVGMNVRLNYDDFSLIYTILDEGVPLSQLEYASNGTISYVEPPDNIKTLSVTQNGTYTAPYGQLYNEVDVTVTAPSPTLQTKTKSYTPTESAQSEAVTCDAGYDGIDTVNISVGAISSSYVGSGITRRDSTDLSASGNTVSVPSGYYENNASKSVSAGSATPASSITATGATVSTGTNTLTLSKSVSNTPQVSAGYISSGTAGNSSVSLTASVTTKAAATIYPGTTDQTIASGTYLTGTQTVKGLTQTNLSAENIKSGTTVTVNNGQSNVWSVTGTYSGGGGSNWTLLGSTTLTINTTSTSASSAGTVACGSGAYTKDDIIWVHIRGQSGKRNGYFYGSDTFFVNHQKANNSTTTFSAPSVEYIRVSSSGAYTTATGSYGVYGYSINSSGTVTIRQRYNSTNTLTINDKFDVYVYKLTLPGTLTLFE